MSLFGKIASAFSGGGARSVCVIDGDRLVGGDKMGPGERFQALNKLSRFASREKMDIRVVFGGRPLREADEGADFNGVKVFYGETVELVRKKLKKQLSSVGASKALLVTSSPKTEEEIAGKTFSIMRVSTLRKAMESGSSERENGGRETNRRSRGGRSRGGRSRGKPSQNGQRASGERSNDTDKSSSADNNDSVKNLIDLVE